MGQLIKSLLIIGLIVVGLLAIFYHVGEQRQATVLQVQVMVEGDLSNASIKDINAHLEQVGKISEPKGTPLIIPGVTVVVIKNMEMIGEWTSVPYSGTGAYNLTVGLTKYPKPGENVRVIARVMDSKSQNLDVATKEITLT